MTIHEYVKLLHEEIKTRDETQGVTRSLGVHFLPG
jgi:hypothetical protein